MHGEHVEPEAVEVLRRAVERDYRAQTGLTPMILSRSGLWSPLASVIAVGLIFSMVFTLLVVPVLYVLVTKDRQAAPVAASVGVRPHQAHHAALQEG